MSRTKRTAAQAGIMSYMPLFDLMPPVARCTACRRVYVAYPDLSVPCPFPPPREVANAHNWAMCGGRVERITIRFDESDRGP